MTTVRQLLAATNANESPDTTLARVASYGHMSKSLQRPRPMTRAQRANLILMGVDVAHLRSGVAQTTIATSDDQIIMLGVDESNQGVEL